MKEFEGMVTSHRELVLPLVVAELGRELGSRLGFPITRLLDETTPQLLPKALRSSTQKGLLRIADVSNDTAVIFTRKRTTFIIKSSDIRNIVKDGASILSFELNSGVTRRFDVHHEEIRDALKLAASEMLDKSEIMASHRPFLHASAEASLELATPRLGALLSA